MTGGTKDKMLEPDPNSEMGITIQQGFEEVLSPYYKLHRRRLGLFKLLLINFFQRKYLIFSVSNIFNTRVLYKY